MAKKVPSARDLGKSATGPTKREIEAPRYQNPEFLAEFTSVLAVVPVQKPVSAAIAEQFSS
jgi:hypothetical protein